MQKKLSVVGNSLALVIDKPLRRMLGLRPDTRVELTTDGRRLVIEPLGTAPAGGGNVKRSPGAGGSPTLARVDAVRTFQALMNRYGITAEQFRRLHHQGIRIGVYNGSLSLGLVTGTDPAEAATLRRLEECLRRLEAGASWEDAIVAALAVVPMAT
jgi:bifunctional DNA-binding transcriptional regulator/antitoxin component of YhaV-PrlF toxin-antitoxin module